MWASRGAYSFLVGKPEGKYHLQDRGVDGRIILKWIFMKWDGVHGLELAQYRNTWRTLVCAIINLRV